MPAPRIRAQRVLQRAPNVAAHAITASCAVVETEGPDGWRGTYRGWADEPGSSHIVSALEGFEAYAGLTFVKHGLGDLPGTRSTGEVDGVIHSGPAPPWDETLPE